MNLITVLARCPPLTDLPLRAIADLSRVVKVRSLEMGERLFGPKDPSESFYIVAVGCLQLVDASRNVLGAVEQGGFLGVTAPILPSEHTIGASAVEPSRVVVLTREGLEQLWEQVPPAAALLEIALAGWITRDLRKAGDELMDLCDVPLRSLTHPGLRSILKPKSG